MPRFSDLLQSLGEGKLFMKSVPRPFARYDSENDLILFFPPGRRQLYDIPVYEMRTHEGLGKWIQHLCGKRWFKGKLAFDFISVLVEVFKYEKQI